MDIKKLELFADVAETLNFTRSGDRMGYTQSGLSHILKSLETEIGFPAVCPHQAGRASDPQCRAAPTPGAHPSLRQ